MNNMQRKIGLIASYGVLILMSIIVIYPILWMVSSSFNTGSSLFSSSIIPKNPTLQNFIDIFDLSKTQYLYWLRNSLKISVFTSFFRVILVTLVSYIFSKYRFYGRSNAIIILLLLQMVPVISALIAFYALGLLIGGIDQHWYLIVIYITTGIPMNTFLMKGYFDSISTDIVSAAKIDGAGHFEVLSKIMIPLATPMMSVIALWGFTAPLGDFVISKIVIRSADKITLAVGLQNLINEAYQEEYALFAAGSIFIAAPIAILFLFLQKYLVAGLTAGGTKG